MRLKLQPRNPAAVTKNVYLSPDLYSVLEMLLVVSASDLSFLDHYSHRGNKLKGGASKSGEILDLLGQGAALSGG